LTRENMNRTARCDHTEQRAKNEEAEIGLKAFHKFSPI
jgi:hypothetical protein